MKARLWRYLRRFLGYHVERTGAERLMAVVGRSEVSRITRAQAQTERPSL
jgi:hypothetical protein